MTDLNDRETEVLEAIKAFIAANGVSPTVREIGDAVGLTSPASVQTYIVRLTDAGYIHRWRGVPRSIRVLNGV